MSQYSPLPHPWPLHLLAAEGWLDLGDAVAARAELQRLPLEFSGHPDVAEVSWRVLAAVGAWKDALAVAIVLQNAAPDRPAGYINRSFTLHELQRTQEAWENLLPVAAKFPELHIIPYNLACYACRLGKRDEALAWLQHAAKIAGKAEIRRLAANDSDLEPLRDAIAAL